MIIDWSHVSTDLTDEQIEEICAPLGQLILVHTQFDLLIGRLVIAFSGLGQNQIVDHLFQAVGAVNKKQILDSFSSIFTSDPNGLVPNYKPFPALRKRLKSVSLAFETASKVRNTAAHGTPGRLGSRVFMGSVAATSFFKNTGGAEHWVFIDEIDSHIQAMLAGMEQARILRDDFCNVHNRINSNLSGKDGT